MDDQVSSEPSITSSRIKRPFFESLKSNAKLDSFDNIISLAPMVRMGTLPFRLLCLKHKCDLVYTEEIICHKIVKTNRIWNAELKTYEYILLKDSKGIPDYSTTPSKSTTSTTPTTLDISSISQNRNQLVLATNEYDHPNSFQMGAPDSASALKALHQVYKDFDCFDLNCGCPKGYSVKGGMGAALLQKPQILVDILKTLVRNSTKPITAKIRLLETPEEDKNLTKTIELVKMIQNTGVAAIALHSRTTPMRPREPAFGQVFKIIKSHMNVPLIANGDFYTWKDIHALQSEGITSFMIARGAIKNPGIFDPTSVFDLKSLLTEFVQLSYHYDHPFSNTKYIAQRIAGNHKYQKQFPQFSGISSGKTYENYYSMLDIAIEKRQRIE